MNRQLLSSTHWLWRVILALLIVTGLGIMSGRTAVQGAEAAWNATYWNNTRLDGTPVLQRTEVAIDYDWGDGSPHTLLSGDNFSARWTRWVYFEGGTYRFMATMDDGMRVWVDNNLLIDSWWDSQVHSLSRDIYLTPGEHQIKVEYYEVGGKAVAKLSWTRVDAAPGTFANWRGEYFNNLTLSGNPLLVRDDLNLDFNWGVGSPAPGTVSADQFSVRWTRTFPLNAGRYRFSVTSDDGARLWVNNQLIIDTWYNHATETFSAEMNVPGGNVPIKLEYFENQGHAEARLNWVQISSAPAPTPTPTPPAGGSLTASVATGALNLRTGPGIGYDIITAVSYGTQVTLTGYRNAAANWVQVRLADGRQGWMNVNYLSTTYPIASLTVMDVPPAPGGTTGQTATVVNAAYLNVRSGPGVSYNVVTVIARGNVVELAGFRNASATWVKIRLANGVQGWVNTAYLQSSYPFSNLTVGG